MTREILSLWCALWGMGRSPRGLSVPVGSVIRMAERGHGGAVLTRRTSGAGGSRTTRHRKAVIHPQRDGPIPACHSQRRLPATVHRRPRSFLRARPSLKAVSMLRITLINDNEIVRRGVVAMLSRYHGQVGFAEHADPGGPQVDIALVDTFAPGLGNGPNLARLIADPRIRRTVVYTWNFQPWLARDVLEQGASGYLSKSLTAAQLVAALQQVHGGVTVVSPSTRPNKVSGSDWPGRAEGLTAREAEVLSLITAGLSNADIATRLSLSPNSIKSYVPRDSGYGLTDGTVPLLRRHRRRREADPDQVEELDLENRRQPSAPASACSASTSRCAAARVVLPAAPRRTPARSWAGTSAPAGGRSSAPVRAHARPGAQLRPRAAHR